VDLVLMGPDRDQLKKWSSEVGRRLADAGFPDVVDEAPAFAPAVSLKPHRDKLAKLGLDPPSIERAMLASTHGVLLSEPQSDSPAIRVFLEDDLSEQEIASLKIPTGNSLVPLRELADAVLVLRVNRLQRRNRRPMVRVTAALPGSGDPAPRDFALRLAEEIGRELRLSDEYLAERH
jgi:multidrug efflux pump subunit AcrB